MDSVDTSAQYQPTDYSLTGGSLLNRLLMNTPLGREGGAGLRARVLGLLAVTYLPLVLLSVVQNVAYNPGVALSFCRDVSELARFLVVGPLLLVAEVLVEPWLVQVVRYAKERLVAEDELPEYEKFVGSAARCRDSNLAELVLLLVTFCWEWLDVKIGVISSVTTWHLLSINEPTYAFLYYAYFAKPLIRFLWLRWVWRYGIWGWLLFRMARLNLKITPTHPDRLGGLFFISVGHSRFCALAFALGIQAASILSNQILFESRQLMSFKYEILGILSIVLLVFLSPLLAFTGKLMDAKRVGLFEYGELADKYTSKFRAKWIDQSGSEEDMLGTSDIQSLADIGNSYSVVREMKTCLIGKETLTAFVAATLLPFSPLILTVYPFDELVKHVLKAIM